MYLEQKYPRKIFYEVACDNCQAEFYDDEGDNLFPSKKDADQEVEKGGWYVGVLETHHCRDCKAESSIKL